MPTDAEIHSGKCFELMVYSSSISDISPKRRICTRSRRNSRSDVKFRRTHGKTRTTGCHVITAPRVIGPDAPTTLDTTGCGPVGQANAALTPFGGLPVEPSDGRSEVGSSDLVQPVLRGVDHCHFVPLLGLIGEGRQRHRRRSSEFLSALRRHLPGEEYAQVCWACAAMVGTCL